MLGEMTSAQVAEWQAYYRLEPWGTAEEDRRTAVVAATVANTVPRRRGSKAWRPQDFMPRREGQQQDWRQQKQMLNALTGR